MITPFFSFLKIVETQGNKGYQLSPAAAFNKVASIFDMEILFLFTNLNDKRLE